MKKALVTGIGGFVGSHLTNHLHDTNFKIYGIYHPRHPSANLKALSDKATLIACDLLDFEDLDANLRKIKPDYIFHLAAFSSPSESFKNPRVTLENNIIAQLNLLESCVSQIPKARILVIGSADEYGEVDEKSLPVTENVPLAPTSPYAVSKVAQDMLGFQFFLHHKLFVVRVRPFNHIGPGQSPNFVVSAFASQIAKLERKGGGTVKVGNLETIRDFTDVRDITRAYLLALTHGKPGEVYNLGSGKLVKISKILDILISFSKTNIKVEKDISRFRSGDVKIIYCDFTKFQKQTGWKPQIPITKTLSDTIDWERKNLK